MADTSVTTKAGNVVQVTYTDNGADWNYLSGGTADTSIFKAPIKVKAIQWHPSADGDILIINEGGVDGPSIVEVEATDTGGVYHMTYGEGVFMRPYIELGDQTWGTDANIKVIFILA